MSNRSSAAPLVLTLLVAGACADMPLATIWKLARLTPSDVLGLDPAGILAAVSTDSGAKLLEWPASLSVTLAPEGAAGVTRDFELKLLAHGRSVDPGLKPAPPGREWYLWGVSLEVAKALRDWQRDVLEHRAEYKHAAMNVAAPLEAPDSLRRAFPFDIWLRLQASSEFLLLFSGTIDLGAPQGNDHQAPPNNSYLDSSCQVGLLCGC